ncbi:MAG TPA: MSMEG_4193 family putative phosphomutase [Actinomycetota bacterium]|jgi:probable phosphoglycerate mutase
MTALFLVRHGLTSHTGSRLTGWTPDVHLTEDGKAGVQRLAQWLSDVPLAAVYSSPIDRTLETARIVAAPHGLSVRTRRGIGEVEYGKWTNRPLRSLMRTKLWGTVQRWPSAARFPDGETLREVQSRAVGEVEKLAGEHPKEAICCVSHGDVIKLIAAHYLGVHIDLFQRIVIAPASVSVISLGREAPHVLSLNSLPVPMGSTS